MTRNLIGASENAKKLVLGKTVNGISRNIFRLRAALGFVMKNPRALDDDASFAKLHDLRDFEGNSVLFHESGFNRGKFG